MRDLYRVRRCTRKPKQLTLFADDGLKNTCGFEPWEDLMPAADNIDPEDPFGQDKTGPAGDFHEALTRARNGH